MDWDCSRLLRLLKNKGGRSHNDIGQLFQYAGVNLIGSYRLMCIQLEQRIVSVSHRSNDKVSEDLEGSTHRLASVRTGCVIINRDGNIRQFTPMLLSKVFPLLTLTAVAILLVLLLHTYGS